MTAISIQSHVSAAARGSQHVQRRSPTCLHTACFVALALLTPGPSAQSISTATAASCTALTFFQENTTSCEPCSSECAEACTGPSSTECVTLLGATGAEACKNFVRGDACVESCLSDSEFVLNDTICEPCFSECNTDPAQGATGCSNSGPSDCNKCKGLYRMVNDTTTIETGELVPECVAQCHTREATASGSSECLPCSSECYGLCGSPLNASSCISSGKKCQNYIASNGSTCVGWCALGEVYVYPSEGDDRCASTCPSSRPFYNDTRDPFDPLKPTFQLQLCVQQCTDLGNDHIFQDGTDPFKCSSLDQATIGNDDENGNSGSSRASTVMFVATVCFMLFCIVFIILFTWCNKHVAWCQDDSSSHMDATESLPEEDLMIHPGAGTRQHFDSQRSVQSYSEGQVLEQGTLRALSSTGEQNQRGSAVGAAYSEPIERVRNTLALDTSEL